MERTIRSAFVQLVIGIVALNLAGNCSADVSPETLEKIDAALPQRASTAARQPRRVLLFSKTNGFRHDSIPVAIESLTRMGTATGAYMAIHSEDDAMFEPDKLGQFDAVIMVNTSGEIFRPKTLPEDPAANQTALQREERLKESLVDFVSRGNGLAGMHAATDTYKNWQEYNDMMGGAFASHPWHTAVPVRLLDPDHPLNTVFGGQGFTITDEIYEFRNDTANPADRRMLLSLNPTWAPTSKGHRDDKFYPISWIAPYGEGRTFYCSLGHRDEIYYNRVVLEHYLAGIQYALGDLAADDAPLAIEN